MIPHKWTADEALRLVQVLVTHKHHELREALDEASKRLGFRVTYDSAQNALKRAGLGSPSSHLGSNAYDSMDEPFESVREDSGDWIDEPPGGCIGDPEPADELERILVVPDCHHPSVDATAWAVLLAAGRLFKPHRIIVLGDFLDMYSTSRHAKDPNRHALLEREVDAGNAALDQLDSLGAKHKHFLQGNHEENLERYLSEKAPALFNIVRIDQLLSLEKRGWSFTKYRQHLKVGKVFYVHDTGSCGPMAHVKSRDAFAGSVVQGHTHHAGVAYAGTARGDAHVGISSGWLGKFDDATYAHDIQKRRAWMHAFTVGWAQPDGVTHLQLIPIINGAACIGGQLVRQH